MKKIWLSTLVLLGVSIFTPINAEAQFYRPMYRPMAPQMMAPPMVPPQMMTPPPQLWNAPSPRFQRQAVPNFQPTPTREWNSGGELRGGKVYRPSPGRRAGSSTADQLREIRESRNSTYGVSNAGERFSGISMHEFRQHARLQESMNWCWAACIEMAFSAGGLDVPQDKIVRWGLGLPQHGPVFDAPGNFYSILRNLTHDNLSYGGRNYHVNTNVYNGLMPPVEAIRHLDRGEPILVGYNTGGSVGHMVLLTGVHYVEDQFGVPHISAMEVHDPMLGFVIYSAAELASRTSQMWSVDVDRY